jgi:hypothetical protein
MRTAMTDAPFERGFPWIRSWTADVPLDPQAVIGAPRWFDRWPRNIGRARARMRGTTDLPTPEMVTPALTAPLTIDDARSLVANGMSRTQPFDQLGMCLLLEVDVGSANMLHVVADAMDRLSDDALTRWAPGLSMFAPFVGFALIRAPEVRDRFEAIFARAPAERRPYTIHGALDRALHGRAGAERNGHPQGPGMHPSSLWFVDDDPDFVRAQILANDEPYERFVGDARCAYLGGADVVRYWVKRWWDVDPNELPQMLYEFGELRDPLIVELMIMVAGEPDEHAATAKEWFASHREFALPILQALAAGSRKKFAEGAAEWIERLTNA